MAKIHLYDRLYSNNMKNLQIFRHNSVFKVPFKAIKNLKSNIEKFLNY